MRHLAHIPIALFFLAPALALSQTETVNACSRLDNLPALHLKGVEMWKQGRNSEAEVCFRTQIDLLEQAGQSGRPDHAWARINLAEVLWQAGELHAAEPVLGEAAEDLRQAGARAAGVAHAFVRLAQLRVALGRYSEAESAIAAAGGVEQFANPVLLARHTQVRAELARIRGRIPEARKLYEETYALWVRAEGPGSQVAAATLVNRAHLERTAGNLREAERFTIQAIRRYEKDAVSVSPGWASAVAHLAELRRLAGRFRDAELSLRRALEAARAGSAGDAGSSRTRGQLLHSLAAVLQAAGRLEEAEEALEQARVVLVVRNSRPDRTVASLLNTLGVLRYSQQRYPAAQAALAEARRILARIAGDEDLQFASVEYNLGVASFATGDYHDARRFLTHALGVRKRLLGTSHPDTAYAQLQMARILRQEGQADEARRLEKQAELVLRAHRRKNLLDLSVDASTLG